MTDLDRTLDAYDAAYDAERRSFWEAAAPAAASADTWLLWCDVCGYDHLAHDPDGWAWDDDGVSETVRCPTCAGGER